MPTVTTPCGPTAICRASGTIAQRSLWKPAGSLIFLRISDWPTIPQTEPKADAKPVLQYSAAEFFYESPDVAVGIVVPEGELIPKSEESVALGAAEARGDVKAARRKRKRSALSATASTGWRKSRRPEYRRAERDLSDRALTAFKSGERKNEMMSIVSQSLSDADIANLAAYYSAIEISVGAAPAQSAVICRRGEATTTPSPGRADSTLSSASPTRAVWNLRSDAACFTPAACANHISADR